MSSGVQRKAYEDRWRKRLETARVNYDAAVVQYRSVMAEQKQAPLPGSDGLHSVHIALRHETAAREEYRECPLKRRK